MSDEQTFKLDELAREADLPPRTVRYYIQRGLLPPPVFRGKETSYGGLHLLRLKAVQRLKDRYLPLDEIQRELEGLSAEALERLVREGPKPKVGPAPAPALPPRRPPDPDTASPPRRFQRWELLPGLELQLSEDASPEAALLARRLRELAGRA